MQRVEFGPKFADNLTLLVAAMGYQPEDEPIQQLELAVGSTKIILNTKEVPALVCQLFHYLICVAAGLSPSSPDLADGYYWTLNEGDRAHACAFVGEYWPPKSGEETPHFVLAFWCFCARSGLDLGVTVLRTKRSR